MVVGGGGAWKSTATHSLPVRLITIHTRMSRLGGERMGGASALTCNVDLMGRVGAVWEALLRYDAFISNEPYRHFNVNTHMSPSTLSASSLRYESHAFECNSGECVHASVRCRRLGLGQEEGPFSFYEY